MLGKLMKYEVKATGRTLIPLYLVLLAFAIINKILSELVYPINFKDLVQSHLY